MTDNSKIQERANLLCSLKRYNEAIKVYMQHLSIEPDNTYSISQLAFCHIKLHHFEECERYLDLGLKLNPNDSWNYYLRSSLACYSNKITEAEELIKTALSLNPEKAIYFVRYASIASLKKDFEQMEKMANKAIQFDPHNEYGYAFLADAYLHSRKYKSAAEVLQNGLKIKPDSSPLHQRLGNIYLENNKIDKAYEHYSAAVGLDPTSEQNVNKYEFIKEVKETLASDDYYDVNVSKHFIKKDGQIVEAYYTLNKKEKENFRNPITFIFAVARLLLAAFAACFFLYYGITMFAKRLEAEKLISTELKEIKGIIDSTTTESVESKNGDFYLSMIRLHIHLNNDKLDYYTDNVPEEFLSAILNGNNDKAKNKILGKECVIKIKKDTESKNRIYYLSLNDSIYFTPGEIDNRYYTNYAVIIFTLSFGFIFSGLSIAGFYFLSKELNKPRRQVD